MYVIPGLTRNLLAKLTHHFAKLRHNQNVSENIFTFSDNLQINSIIIAKKFAITDFFHTFA